MKVTYNWLKDYVDIDLTPYQLQEKLVNAGFEVEEIIDLSLDITNTVTGKIVTSTKHPDADKLSVCTVDINSTILQIVCGADNAIAGSIVPVALEGANLPGGFKIKKSKLRGVASEGMLLSGNELGLSESDYTGAGYNGLFVLPEDTMLGIDINKVIKNDDYVLNINVTANRPDCNSVIGIAREIAAITNKALKTIPVQYNITEENSGLMVEVIDSNLCPRYMARVVKGVKVERSPELVRRRLRAVGLRTINNIVDITNYVLIEIGQPMHAFDIRYLSGNKIIVRRAKKGESITALDDKKYVLKENYLAICDESKPIAIGGIMGGINSGVIDDTTTIVLESAKFNRENIRRSSRELNLRSDSSARFEKGVDYSTQNIAIERALTLLNCGYAEKNTIDIICEDIATRQITFSAEEISNILGIQIDSERIINQLNSLSISSRQIDGGKIQSIIPISREDIVGVNDIAEEVIRLYGYHHIDSYKLPVRGGKTSTQLFSDKIKDYLTGNNMNEIITYAFTTPKSFEQLKLKSDNRLRQAIRLMNPLGEDLSIMRTNLIHSMLSTISSNYNKGNKSGRLFELASVYMPKALPLEELPQEIATLCLAVFGKGEDFYSLKGIVSGLYDIAGIEVKYIRTEREYLHPGKSAEIIYKGKSIGVIGVIYPDVLDNYEIKTPVIVAELSVIAILDNYIKIREFNMIPKYPSVVRDLALIVDEDLPVGDIIDYIKGYNMLIEAVSLFDIYKGSQIEAGKKSVALSVTMRDKNRTLTLEETSQLIDRLLGKLNSKFNAMLRE